MEEKSDGNNQNQNRKKIVINDKANTILFLAKNTNNQDSNNAVSAEYSLTPSGAFMHMMFNAQSIYYRSYLKTYESLIKKLGIFQKEVIQKKQHRIAQNLKTAPKKKLSLSQYKNIKLPSTISSSSKKAHPPSSSSTPQPTTQPTPTFLLATPTKFPSATYPNALQVGYQKSSGIVSRALINCALSLLSSIISDFAFDFLRSKHQLGYSVDCYVSGTTLFVEIVSGQYSTMSLWDHIELFILNKLIHQLFFCTCTECHGTNLEASLRRKESNEKKFQINNNLSQTNFDCSNDQLTPQQPNKRKLCSSTSSSPQIPSVSTKKGKITLKMVIHTQKITSTAISVQLQPVAPQSLTV
jgi:hypothetical protein